MYRPSPPLPSVKIGEGAPSPIFTEGMGGGGVCTQVILELLDPIHDRSFHSMYNVFVSGELRDKLVRLNIPYLN